MDTAQDMGKNRFRIETDPAETFFADWFHRCKTLEFTSKDGRKRQFVECVDETDWLENITGFGKYENMSVKNAVQKMLKEGCEDFFFPKNEKGTSPVTIGDITRYVKVEDVTSRWSNHYWVRTKRPIIGFKAVTAEGGTVIPKPRRSLRFEVGETYTFDEDIMLNGYEFGAFFSPSYYKALSYMKDGYKMYLVAGSGLILVKNHWNDLAASTLRIIRRLTEKDRKLLDFESPEYRGFWNETHWDSYDYDFASELWH